MDAPQHELKAPGIEYIFEDSEKGRKTLNKIYKKFKINP